MKTPCIRVCRINPGNYTCEGCYRTLQEIKEWTGMSDEQREALMKELPNRKPKE